MAQTQHGYTASISLADLTFLWLCASAQKSPPLHAEVPVFACVVHISKCLVAGSHPPLTPSWVHINMMGSPEARKHLHICKVSHWMGAFWNKTNHPFHALNTAGLAQECCSSWTCSRRQEPSLCDVLHVVLGSGALQGLWWCWWKLHCPHLVLHLKLLTF